MQFVARLTTDIVQTFEKCNPEFKYSESLNPKRFLTNPAVPAHNDGHDNANSDLILYVNLELVNRKSDRRLVFFFEVPTSSISQYKAIYSGVSISQYN
jgi:dual specificity protein kinase YAK1